MISSSDRRQAIQLIDEAREHGARLASACDELNISPRTYQRWKKEGEHTADKRPLIERKAPKNKLTEEEKEEILSVCHSETFVDLPPSQIVPKLADEGTYIASESTFYRVLKEAKQHAKRRPVNKSNPRPISTHIATAPNQVWTWDITWLPGEIAGHYYKLYLIIDIFSRFIVGWEIHEKELSIHAENLIKKAVFKHGVLHQPLVLHSDNGSPMKAQDFQNLLTNLGITKSYSRPRVSNDNPYSEALFKTLKYVKDFPYKGFSSIEKAREWVHQFVHQYNHEFLHSGITYVTPYQRHYGLDTEILAKREEVYLAAKENKPERWTRQTRNWSRIDQVALNPINEQERLVDVKKKLQPI